MFWKGYLIFSPSLFFSAAFTGISQPYRLDIFEDFIYGTGLKHEVFKIHKYGKQPVEFLNLGMEKPTNVLISHRYKQQDGELLRWSPPDLS